MSTGPETPNQSPPSLASQIRKFREGKKLSLDELATKAGISKTYLWELERDIEGTKKPSADVLVRIANELSTTLAVLLGRTTVQVQGQTMELPPALRDFKERMDKQQTPLDASDLNDLATMKFRGAQPQTADEWHQLYLLMLNAARRTES